MSQIRTKVLSFLHAYPQSSIKDISAAVGMGTVSLRHHINLMLRQGLLLVENKRHGVGRPLQVFSLSASGQEIFPTRYYPFTNVLLEKMKSRFSGEAVQLLIQDMAEDLSREANRKTAMLSMQEKAAFLKAYLTELGYQVKIRQPENGMSCSILELNCPYRSISRQHPEICLMDEKLISSVMKAPVIKSSCVLKGDACCSYQIQFQTR